MKNPFNIIHDMIQQYEKATDEKPYVILVSPKTYMNLREELEDSNAWRYLAKLQDDKTKINYIFDIPVEISHYIIQEAICMNERDYKKYCDYRFQKDLFKSEVE